MFCFSNHGIVNKCVMLQNYFDVISTNGTVYVKSALDRETVEVVTLTLLVQDLNAWNPPVDQQTDTGMCDLDITGTRSQCLKPASGSTDRHRYV